MRLSPEHLRRQRLNLAARGSWTYPHRNELKRRGFLWDGASWLAPDADTLQQAVRDLRDAPFEREWSVTVHGDAGWKDGIGRWAWFCRSHLPPELIEGTDQGPCQNSGVAEARALLWGVRAAFATWPPPSTPGTLFLRSDNKGVLDCLSLQRDNFEDMVALRALIPAHLTLNVKHVPGHQRANTTAAWVNRRVDQASHLRGETGRNRLKR